MYGPLNRAQMRDEVRRRLGQIPFIDDSAGAAGAQPTRFPYPTNAFLNTALDDAVAFFSRKCKIAGDPVPREVPIPAQTDNGPFVLDLYRLDSPGSTNSVRRASWRISGGIESPLRPANRDDMDRDRTSWADMTPSTPERYWIEAGSLMVYPAPSAAGTLLLMLSTALWSQSATVDGEVLEIIPTDHLPTVVAKTALLICERFPDDAEFRALIPVFNAEVQDGLLDMTSFFAQRNRSYQGRMTPSTGRITRGYGNR